MKERHSMVILLLTRINTSWAFACLYKYLLYLAGLILVPTAKNSRMPTIPLTAEGFREKVFDYTKDQEWQYNGSLPAIIDFYADWCGPCKAVAPVLEELSAEYEGRLLIYKIDTEQEAELSGLFGIQSIPTLLFIPVHGAPMMQKGAIPKNAFQQVIEERLLLAKDTAG